jgi:penicillin-insensitive murein endopeptidase
MAAMWRQGLVFGSVLLSASLVLGAPDLNPWPNLQSPSPGPARAIGEYSAGCVAGAVALPLEGPGYQVMRPSRRRYFGHPRLLSFIRTLGKGVKKAGLGRLLVGDLSQPRGGRASGGHSSHQTGLDVDLWFWHPGKGKQALLSAEECETLAAPSVLDAKASALRKPWKKRVAQLLRLSVDKESVDRVFVNPVIKRELCTTSGSEDRAWLRKLRPWHGHDDHFHVRLACPPGETGCRGQAPLPPGDGCTELDWWFDVKAQAARKEAQQDYQRNVKEGRGWPEQCDALLQ